MIELDQLNRIAGEHRAILNDRLGCKGVVVTSHVLPNPLRVESKLYLDTNRYVLVVDPLDEPKLMAPPVSIECDCGHNEGCEICS